MTTNLSNGNDIFYGNNSLDEVLGNGGHDIIFGLDSDDNLYGGDYVSAFLDGPDDGNDILNGDGGNDVLFGGTGNDSLYGGANHDYIVGGYGHDLLVGGVGDDNLSGGQGNDTFIGAGRSSSRSSATVSFGIGEIDILNAGTSANNGNDTFVLGHKSLFSSVSFYNDGNASSKGLNDYAGIVSFNKNEDTIKLAGSKSLYVLKDSPISLGASTQDTAIFLKGNNGAVDELIAVIQDVGITNLSLNGNYFQSL